jgi:hypothetical protein
MLANPEPHDFSNFKRRRLCVVCVWSVPRKQLVFIFFVVKTDCCSREHRRAAKKSPSSASPRNRLPVLTLPQDVLFARAAGAKNAAGHDLVRA